MLRSEHQGHVNMPCEALEAPSSILTRHIYIGWGAEFNPG